MGALEHAEDNFSLIHRGQGCYGVGVAHQAQHSNPGIHQVGCDWRYAKPKTVLNAAGRFRQVGK
ncbi:hypothetical protein AA303_08835 [Pseudomonas psychrophila]|nr:hypothetical protein AA303_08835 [Pseudomonas psychrophila]